jgi:hypothetical protein
VVLGVMYSFPGVRPQKRTGERLIANAHIENFEPSILRF